MSETTKDDAKPKKLPLWRKLGVVAGLVVFAFVALVSLALSDRRPSLKAMHDRINNEIRAGGRVVHLSQVSKTLGPSTHAGVFDAVKNGRFIPREMRAWNDFDYRHSQYHTLRLTVDREGRVRSSRCDSVNMSVLEHTYTHWILPIGWRVRQFLGL